MYYVLDQKRQHLFALAALIKSLADVPEQVKVVLRGNIYIGFGSYFVIIDMACT